MGRKRYHAVHEQWDYCQICGFVWPMSHLVRQKGALVCTDTCFSELDVEQRNAHIEQVLGQNVGQELSDKRHYDWSSFFQGQDREEG